MANLALPLSILDGSGTASSIARYTDGNATPPKNLVTLGTTEGQITPYKISCWNNCVVPITASLSTFCAVGGTGAGSNLDCACLAYDGTSPVWTACWCWRIQVREDGGNAGARVCMLCNGASRLSCSTTAPVICSGTFATTQNSVTTICMYTCTCAGAGSYEARGNACIRLYCSTSNIGGVVVIGTPSQIAGYSCVFF